MIRDQESDRSGSQLTRDSECRRRTMKVAFLSVIAAEICALLFLLACFGADRADHHIDGLVMPVLLLLISPIIISEFEIYRCLSYLILIDKDRRSRILSILSCVSLAVSSLFVITVTVCLLYFTGTAMPGFIIRQIIWLFGFDHALEIYTLLLIAADAVYISGRGILKLRRLSAEYESEIKSNIIT